MRPCRCYFDLFEQKDSVQHRLFDAVILKGSFFCREMELTEVLELCSTDTSPDLQVILLRLNGLSGAISTQLRRLATGVPLI